LALSVPKTATSQENLIDCAFGSPCEDAGAMTPAPPPPSSGEHPVVAPVLSWYAIAARDLPWRLPDTSAWAVLVSEVMLQQTPVARVLPAYSAWLARWPTPAALAAASPGDAVRMWAKLGYPRRALRLHECASEIVARHGGRVPCTVAELLALPGIGEYTARAVAAFAYAQRHPVVDTNVRRVLGRLLEGSDTVAIGATARDRAAAAALLPTDSARAARFSVALMEFGALVCTARSAQCDRCPVAHLCRWRALGYPPPETHRRPAQRYAGTDRQVRGLLLDVLRGAAGPVSATALDRAWPDPAQRGRALDGLVADGLIDPLPDGRYALPR
jgi:A/G-specific adenine glycosylase